MTLGPSKGTVDFLLCVKRDEPISPLDFVLALIRPITECVLLRCCCACACLPCILCCCRRKKSSAASKKPRRSGLSGERWRNLLRIFGIVVIVAAAIHIVVLLHSKDSAKLLSLANLFIKAKLFGWFVTEPGALLWTYGTIYTVCPRLLPQQSLEAPCEPAPARGVEPVRVFDPPMARPLLQAVQR
eukprot:UN1044